MCDCSALSLDIYIVLAAVLLRDWRKDGRTAGFQHAQKKYSFKNALSEAKALKTLHF
jgi:hypothetical protein